MRKRDALRLALFFFLLWQALFSFSAMVHEFGHALAMMVSHQRNSVSFTEGTMNFGPEAVLTPVAKAQESGLTPAEWGREQQLEATMERARESPADRVSFLGGPLFKSRRHWGCSSSS